MQILISCVTSLPSFFKCSATGQVQCLLTPSQPLAAYCFTFMITVLCRWTILQIAVFLYKSSVIFVNENKNGEKRENNEFVNEN